MKRRTKAALRANVLAMLKAYADDPHNEIDFDLVDGLLESIDWRRVKPATIIKTLAVVMADLDAKTLREMSDRADHERGFLVRGNAEAAIREALMSVGASEVEAEKLADLAMDDLKVAARPAPAEAAVH